MTDNDDSAHERALLLALLKEAVDTYCLQPRTTREFVLQHEAALWFSEYEHSHDGGYTFSDVCAYLNLNESYLRRMIYRRATIVQSSTRLMTNGKRRRRWRK